MTEEDQNAAVGRMVSRFSDAKKRRAALLSTAQDLGNQFSRIGGQLIEAHMMSTFSDGARSQGVTRQTDVVALKYPEAAEVNKLIDELKMVSAEIRTIRQQLKDAGLSVE